ncbi:unnamed protein product, partial [marine sediment metagenome]
AINVAIGSYNFSVIDDAKGREDIFGFKLKSTVVALADEVCSAAELVMGQAGEMIPVAIIRSAISSPSLIIGNSNGIISIWCI